MCFIDSFFLRNIFWTLINRCFYLFLRIHTHAVLVIIRYFKCFWKVECFNIFFVHFSFVVFYAVVSLAFLSNTVFNKLYFSSFSHCSILLNLIRQFIRIRYFLSMLPRGLIFIFNLRKQYSICFFFTKLIFLMLN